MNTNYAQSFRTKAANLRDTIAQLEAQLPDFVELDSSEFINDLKAKASRYEAIADAIEGFVGISSIRIADPVCILVEPRDAPTAARIRNVRHNGTIEVEADGLLNKWFLFDRCGRFLYAEIDPRETHVQLFNA